MQYLPFRVGKNLREIRVSHKFDFQSDQEALDSELVESRIQLKNIEDELSRITDILQKNKNFSDYIAKKNVYVKNPNGETPIKVTKDTLLEYSDLEDVNSARKDMLVDERNALKSKIATIESSQEKNTTLFDLNTVESEMISRLSNFKKISVVEVNSMLKKFNKEKKAISEALKRKTMENNVWITAACNIIKDYATELGFSFNFNKDMFSSNIKNKSGAILHKIVFVYKLAYIKLISQKLGYPVPIFCDSPSGREVLMETITEMLGILKRDFSEHQIFIASLHKHENVFEGALIIEMNGKLFDMPSLFY
jgi:hypothetical protein